MYRICTEKIIDASVDRVYDSNASQQNAINEGLDKSTIETFTRKELASVLPYFIG